MFDQPGCIETVAVQGIESSSLPLRWKLVRISLIGLGPFQVRFRCTLYGIYYPYRLSPGQLDPKISRFYSIMRKLHWPSKWSAKGKKAVSFARALSKKKFHTHKMISNASNTLLWLVPAITNSVDWNFPVLTIMDYRYRGFLPKSK